MKTQKGSALVWVIIIIVILVIAGGIYFYSQPKQSSVVPTQNRVATSTVATSTDMVGWLTYTDNQYGFQVSYPISWTIYDNSQTYPVTYPNEKGPGIIISSPLRYGLPGYENHLVDYTIMFDPAAGIEPIADFSSPDFSHQSAWNVGENETVRDAQPEYKIGQQIISSFKIIPSTIKSSLTLNQIGNATIPLVINNATATVQFKNGSGSIWSSNTANINATDTVIADINGDNMADAVTIVDVGFVDPDNSNWLDLKDNNRSQILVVFVNENKDPVYTDQIKLDNDFYWGGVNVDSFGDINLVGETKYVGATTTSYKLVGNSLVKQ